MNKIKTRFAPSPTGYLHIGNARTALINWLFAKKHGGEFILRLDDTDLERSKDAYKDAIIKDLHWLGLEWDTYFTQRSRLDKYDQAKAELIQKGRLYACYETPEELDVKRKLQLSRGLPPIYDRAGLKLTPEQISSYTNAGRKPHYRFLIQETEISWQDMVKGEIKYHGSNLSDPVIIRADGSMTYMLCSTIDDIEYDITHVIRGEDHVSNTAMQIQMFESFGAQAPTFGHLSLVKSKDEKISKREGGFEISSLRDKEKIEAMAINSFFALIGSSNHVNPFKELSDLIENFDISTYSKSPTTYMPEDLALLNHKLILQYEYHDIKNRLGEIGCAEVSEKFWLAVRPNLNKLIDVKDWWEICSTTPNNNEPKDLELMSVAIKALPASITSETWKEWTNIISKETGKKGKDLFLPLRLSLTGKSSGPELRDLLPLLSRQEIINRLNAK